VTEEMFSEGCDFCPGTLPTIRLRSTKYTAGKNLRIRICRACILVALKGIEEPEEYPSVIEDRDWVLETLRVANT
jgi:hypothetical protein